MAFCVALFFTNHSRIIRSRGLEEFDLDSFSATLGSVRWIFVVTVHYVQCDHSVPVGAVEHRRKFLWESNFKARGGICSE